MNGEQERAKRLESELAAADPGDVRRTAGITRRLAARCALASVDEDRLEPK